MKTVVNTCIIGMVVLFFAVTFLQLSRGLISEAVGAAMITGFLITVVKK